MRDANYAPRNFATLGPSELRPPFTGPSRSKLPGPKSRSQVLLSFQHRAGVRPNTSCCHFAESWVFNKLSLLPILCHQAPFDGAGPSLSRSYGGILPSSFNTVLPSPKFSQLVHRCRIKYGVFCFQLFPGKRSPRQSIQFPDLNAWRSYHDYLKGAALKDCATPRCFLRSSGRFCGSLLPKSAAK